MKNLWWILLIVVIALGWWWFASTGSTTDTVMDENIAEVSDISYIDISPVDVKDLIDTTDDLVILDMSNAYAAGHIPGAINYYVGDGLVDAAIKNGDLDSSKPYLVYCHTDSASISGAKKLIEAEFSPVYRLEGNYSAWSDAGYDIEK
ncbi:MAG: rhodanese-like domain-containing protein [Patescibacteria group bacterium]|nr:rhodanese-like domain-containing protein [Patescibacteria group bacterium]